MHLFCDNLAATDRRGLDDATSFTCLNRPRREGEQYQANSYQRDLDQTHNKGERREGLQVFDLHVSASQQADEPRKNEQTGSYR